MKGKDKAPFTVTGRQGKRERGYEAHQRHYGYREEKIPGQGWNSKQGFPPKQVKGTEVRIDSSHYIVTPCTAEVKLDPKFELGGLAMLVVVPALSQYRPVPFMDASLKVVVYSGRLVREPGWGGWSGLVGDEAAVPEMTAASVGTGGKSAPLAVTLLL